MILNRLVDYYGRLHADPEEDIAPLGFSRQKISFEVVINANGSLSALQDARTDDNGRLVPRQIVVPGQAKPSGSGINPGFLWDNAAYMLGFKPDDPRPDRTLRSFEAFRNRHLARENEIGDESFSAVCRFLREWTPNKAADHARLAEIATAFGVFRLAGETRYVHDRPKVKAYWATQIGGDTDAPLAPSLISGEVQPIARLHEPKIKGVRGGQSSGATLVAFNADAYESYGKSQSFNAPVGIEDAFKYCTALNRLTTARERQVHLGDTTVVYWSEKPTPFENDLSSFFEGPFAAHTSAEDTETLGNLQAFFNRLRRAAEGARFEEGDVPFYVLGLSPNAARVSVRFWLVGTVQEFAEQLGRHVENLQIAGLGQTPTLRQLILETGRTKNGWPDEESVSPLLAGAVLRSVLAGLAYPATLLSALVQRIGAEGSVSPLRAAILRAILIRNWSIPMDVYLNKVHPEKAYHCGRLLAVLAFAQELALGTVNAGIIRRNLGSVMTSPGLMLGRLQRAAEVGHIAKLEGDLPIFVRDEIKSINVMLRDDIPVYLDLRLQGVFALGFYQQLQHLSFIEKQVSGRKRHRTDQGEWVRSKLEVRVARALAKFDQIYIYEMSAILPSAGERWPDFVVRGHNERDNLYIEVLGRDTPEYNERWDKKRSAYDEFGVTESGGPRGRLIVLDFRKSQFDELAVQNALREHVTPTQEANQEDTERN
jgi:CRISPR-associated protein Csd1